VVLLACEDRSSSKEETGPQHCSKILWVCNFIAVYADACGYCLFGIPGEKGQGGAFEYDVLVGLVLDDARHFLFVGEDNGDVSAADEVDEFGEPAGELDVL
jgi:hypothetical protein